jgi:hypothetical protein
MWLTLATVLLVVFHCVLGLSQDEPSFYPTKHPEYKGPEWDHYPLNPEPYPRHKRPPADKLWPLARTQNQWKIDSLSLQKGSSPSGIAASFNIYRSSWQICVDDIVQVLWQPCGWQLDKQYMKCSSESGARNGWFTCDEHLYTKGGNTTVEKELEWIKWRFQETANDPASRQVNIQFVHGVPLVPCIASMPGVPPETACSPP